MIERARVSFYPPGMINQRVGISNQSADMTNQRVGIANQSAGDKPAGRDPQPVGRYDKLADRDP